MWRACLSPRDLPARGRPAGDAEGSWAIGGPLRQESLPGACRVYINAEPYEHPNDTIRLPASGTFFPSVQLARLTGEEVRVGDVL